MARGLLALRALLMPSQAPPAHPRTAKIIAHRGSDGAAPNSVEACQAAVLAGADGVEVDVSVTRDGVPVLWHDRDPSSWLAWARQLGAEGMAYVPQGPRWHHRHRKPVTRLALEEFMANYGYVRARSLSPGFLMPRRPRWQPDTLREFLAWAASTAALHTVMLDLKLASGEVDRIPFLLDVLETELASSTALAHRTIYLLTTETEVFRALSRETKARSRLQSLRVTADFEHASVVRSAHQLGARHVSIGTTLARFWPIVREDLIQAVKARDRGELDSVTVWTLNGRKGLGEVLQLGVDNVLTDKCANALTVRRHLQLIGTE